MCALREFAASGPLRRADGAVLDIGAFGQDVDVFSQVHIAVAAPSAMAIEVPVDAPVAAHHKIGTLHGTRRVSIESIVIVIVIIVIVIVIGRKKDQEPFLVVDVAFHAKHERSGKWRTSRSFGKPKKSRTEFAIDSGTVRERNVLGYAREADGRRRCRRARSRRSPKRVRS